MVNPSTSNIGGYKGNVNLKKSNQAIEWTPELFQEYIKCSQDVVYFTETYMKIISIDEGLINFKLYPYQKEMLKNYKDNRFNITTTARQAGKSTTTCAYILWYIIFNPDKTVALLANKGDTAREILGRVQLAYQHLPKWLQQGVREWNKGSFELENNSRVIAAATSASAIRGYSINLLFIDEAAFIENWDEFFTSVYPTISSGSDSKIILVSTPNGLNHFHAIWQYAVQGKNQYKHLKVLWQDVPGRDEKWRQDTLSALNFDLEKFNQEYECEFLGSSGTLIAGWKLKELVYQPTIAQSEGLYQFYSPEKNNVYVMICDVSRGKGLDYSAFQVIDVTKMPYQQVCIYRNNAVAPIDYADVIHRVAKAYNNASVLVEINDIGEQISNSLHYDFAYENILFTENAGRSGKRITSGFGNSGTTDKGIRTTKVVKSVGCSILKLLIEQNQLIVNDQYTINELSTFSKKGNSYEAEQGKHDDLVMCLVLFSWLSEQQYFKDYTNINTLMSLREKSEEDMEQDMSPFGFFDDGRRDIEYDQEFERYSPESWMWNTPRDF
ncbi:large terminase protein [uncultured Caudovirales phage]|uniref:Large terminase protein n=1 Tax=uncultured Caudovirales phage TaxID=2100421 RepID=A0A6J5NVN6_9CAUD|nr:large terminase protein [uncultured Caudovirales phage]